MLSEAEPTALINRAGIITEVQNTHTVDNVMVKVWKCLMLSRLEGTLSQLNLVLNCVKWIPLL